eukprot:5147978-Prymnesium_polylepis.1
MTRLGNWLATSRKGHSVFFKFERDAAHAGLRGGSCTLARKPPPTGALLALGLLWSLAKVGSGWMACAGCLAAGLELPKRELCLRSVRVDALRGQHRATTR